MCLDGSPVGFYWSPGQGLQAYNWMIYFQGGGWCYDDYDCLGRSKTTLGSSKTWSPTGNIGGLLSNDCKVNPRFCNYSMVWMPYCDGNSFSGMRDEPLMVNGTALYFRGRRNIDAIMAALAANVQKAVVPWSSAFDVVLTGCSAGGLATYMHADYVGGMLAPNRPSPPGGPARVGNYHVIPISGFFQDAPNVEGVHVYGDQIKSIHYMSNATYGTNDACIAGEGAGNEWKCNMAPYIYPYITSPIFPLNSFYDSWQTHCILTAEPVVGVNVTNNGNCSAAPGWSSCASNPQSCSTAEMGPVNNFRAEFIASMNGSATAHKTGNGGFISSCFTHCEAQGNDFDVFAIGGTIMRDAVTAWVDSEGKDPADAHFFFDCEYNVNTPHACNPTCGMSSGDSCVTDFNANPFSL